MRRVAVFIDGLNVRFRLQECRWCEFYDVAHLARQLAGPRQLIAVLFYHPQPSREQLGERKYADERAYLGRIRRQEGVTAPSGAYMAKRERWVDGKKVQIWQEKQTDVLLASDLLYMAAKGMMDVTVVASADADIVPAIRRCGDLGVPVELLRFRGAMPRLYELEQVATRFLRARPAYFRPYNAGAE